MLLKYLTLIKAGILVLSQSMIELNLCVSVMCIFDTTSEPQVQSKYMVNLSPFLQHLDHNFIILNDYKSV